MPRLLKIVAGVMLVAHPGFAQTGAPPPSGPAPAPAAVPAQVDISVKPRSTLGPAEMVTQAREYRVKAQEVLLRIQSLQDQAKKEKDIIRLNCLTDKLVQARVNINIAEQAITSLDEAVRRKDEGSTLHEFTRVTIVHQKAQVLGTEAEQCVGEDLSFVGATRVDVETSNEMPTGNSTATDPSPTTPIDYGRPTQVSGQTGM